MSKHLLKFDTETAYQTAKRNHLLVPNVSLVVSPYNVHVNSAFVSMGDAVAGDIIAYDLSGNQKVVKAEAWETVKSKGYTPEGIVVVPANHTNDGTVKAMSVHFMDAENAAKGSTSEKTLVWGPYSLGDDVAGLTNYTSIIYGEDGSANPSLLTRSYAYMPSDSFYYGSAENKGSEYKQNGVKSFVDGFGYYYTAADEQGGWCIPNPYLADGSPNPKFYESGISNVLNQFGKGATNTDTLWNLMNDSNLAKRKELLAKGVTDDDGNKISGNSIVLWAKDDAFVKTVITAENQGSDRGYTRMYPVTVGDVTTWYGVGAYGKPAIGATIWGGVADGKVKNTDFFYTYPAALSTKLYGTANMTAGNWFLPDAAQLALIMPYKDRIKYALDEIGTDYAAKFVNSWLWSSSEYLSSRAWYLNPSNGYVYYGSLKCDSSRVRAFAAFSI